MTDSFRNSDCRWQDLYSAAILETDPGKGARLIVQAEWAIILRRYALLSRPDATLQERQELDTALAALRMIKAAV